MVEKCEFCGKTFEKLSQLYMHKQSHTPSLLFHQHPHPAFGMDTKQIALKRQREDDNSPTANKLQVISKLSDDSDFEPSSYNKGKSLKRKRRSDDEDPVPVIKKLREKDTISSGFEIKPYDRNEKKIRRGKVKKDKNKGRKFKKVFDTDEKELELPLDIANPTEELRGSTLKTVDIFNPDYEKEDEREKQDTRREIKNLKNKFTDMIKDEREDCEDMIEEEREKCRDTLLNVKNQHKAKVANMKEGYKDELIENEKKCNEMILQRDKVYKVQIDNMNEKFEDEMKEKDKEFEAMEKDFRRKIDMLNKHLRSEQEDEDYLTPLAHAIFNCTTIEEIFEIKNLIESYRVNELTNKHYKTLQNMFLSLSYGVLPICQPQRDTITDSQRELVGKIQNSSFNTAKEVLKENREEIANLFSIIEDSLNLAINSFNRYVIRQEGNKRRS